MAESDKYRAQQADARARTLNHMVAQLSRANQTLYAAAPTMAQALLIDAALLDLLGPFHVFVEAVSKILTSEGTTDDGHIGL